MKATGKARRGALWLSALVLVAGAWIVRPIEYDNSRSRYFLAASIAERGTLAIDAYAPFTLDLSASGGHHYSSKAIGAPFLAAPVWWLLRHGTPLGGAPDLDLRLLHAVRVATTTLPSALFVLVFFSFARRLGASPRDAGFLTLAYAFGTLAFLHSTLFSGHQLAAVLCFTGFSLVVSVGRGEGRAATAGAAGVLLGWGVLSDYLAAAAAIVVGVYTIVRLRRHIRALLAFAAGGALPLGVLLTYNTVCFGDPFSLSYARQATGDFARGAEQGVLGISGPSPAHLAALLVSPGRGLFFLSPFLLLAIPGLRRLLRGEWRAEAVVLLLVPASMLLLNAGFYGWHGGWSYGPRYVTVAVPFLAVAAAPVIATHRLLFGALAALSVALLLPAAIGCPEAPDIFRNPLVECLLPLLQEGYLADTILGWPGRARALGFLPLAGIAAALVYRAFRELPADGPAEAAVPLRQQLAALGAVGCALSLALTFVRTDRSPGTEGAFNVHYVLGRLCDDIGDARPELLPRAARELALGDEGLPAAERRTIVEFQRLRFGALVRLAKAQRTEGRRVEAGRTLEEAHAVVEEWGRRTPARGRLALRIEVGRVLLAGGFFRLAEEQIAASEQLAPSDPAVQSLRAELTRATSAP